MLHHLLVCVVVSTLLCENNLLMISEQYFLYHILDLLDIYKLVLCNFYYPEVSFNGHSHYLKYYILK